MDPMIVAGLNLGVGLFLVYVSLLLRDTSLKQREINRLQKEIGESISRQIAELQARRDTEFQEALGEIQMIRAGLNGISRPLIRSLRNTVEPNPGPPPFPPWWATVAGLTGSMGLPLGPQNVQADRWSLSQAATDLQVRELQRQAFNLAAAFQTRPRPIDPAP